MTKEEENHTYNEWLEIMKYLQFWLPKEKKLLLKLNSININNEISHSLPFCVLDINQIDTICKLCLKNCTEEATCVDCKTPFHYDCINNHNKKCSVCNSFKIGSFIK
jgi:hypothetical protein